MSTTIAILSQKGGTGKTTLTRSLAEGLRRSGLSVLAIDADPQGNLSEYFGIPADAFPTLGEVLAGQQRAVDAVHQGPGGGEVIPANLGLAEAELMLAGKIGRELTLRNALREPKRRFDVILIDCPPTLGLLTVNALVAADRAILSTQAEHFSEQGAEQAMEVIGLAKENLNPDLELLGLLLNIADMRTNHARSTLETMRSEFGDLVFDTVIRRSIVYPESARAGKPIFEYRRRKSIDYARLTVEVLERLDFPAALGAARSQLAESEPGA
ncbi:MAG: ParA family protein [Solirubrobacterales bacterium]|nr:ParA family protein [Solirubrobacterales bacterium]HMT05249.1 ParA family protein [Solirubrobacterales bacterium]